ncbi:hypothetical protein [Thiocystis violascens]|uniref:hypothetical protein n=1 Tax=Thiocystis violascens TaxID=73141 RepID=UPI00145F01D9|nr:hypothetical protein [Thiocystis violascens]
MNALFRDLLIGVTNFFRDPAAFQALEERVIPTHTVSRQSLPGLSSEKRLGRHEKAAVKRLI